MKKLYIDNTSQGDGPIGVFVKDIQVIYTGTEINTEPARMRNEQIVQDAADSGISFFFDDEQVSVNLYTVPFTVCFARDNCGGCFVKETDDDTPVYYIDSDRHIGKVAENFSAFLKNLPFWRENRIPDQRIVIFSSREEAEQVYEIYSMNELIAKNW